MAASTGSWDPRRRANTASRTVAAASRRIIVWAKSPLGASTSAVCRNSSGSRKYARASSSGMLPVAPSRERPRTPTEPARASSRRAWPRRSRATLATATSSSSSGAAVTHWVSRWVSTRASSPSIRQYSPRSAGSIPSGTVVSTPASGSSNPVPKAQCPSPPWAWSSASYTVSSCANAVPLAGGCRGRLHVRDGLRDLVERRVAVDLVAARGEHRVLLVRAGRRDVGRLDDPDAHALVAPGVEVAGRVHRHLVVRGVQRADVHVVDPALSADEHLVQRPVPAADGQLGLDRHLGPGRDGAVPAFRGDVAPAG